MKKDPVLEDLEEVRDELENSDDKPKNKFFSKKFVSIFLSIFLVLIIASYIYLSGPVYSYIYGLAGSSKLEGNSVFFKNDVVVYFNNETLSFLQSIYDPVGDEKAVCLLGEVKDGVYEVNSYYKPLVRSSGWNFVSHVPCSPDTIIMLHTHPFKRCAPSSTDEQTLRITKLSNQELIMLVMCGNNRFSAVI